MDAQEADTQSSDLNPWSEIEGDEDAKVMEMPIGYSGSRDTAPIMPEDLDL